MPGTGMSIARYVIILFWIALGLYLAALGSGLLAKKFPNAVTLAVYRVFSRA